MKPIRTFISQYGHVYRARTIKELREQPRQVQQNVCRCTLV